MGSVFIWAVVRKGTSSFSWLHSGVVLLRPFSRTLRCALGFAFCSCAGDCVLVLRCLWSCVCLVDGVICAHLSRAHVWATAGYSCLERVRAEAGIWQASEAEQARGHTPQTWRCESRHHELELREAELRVAEEEKIKCELLSYRWCRERLQGQQVWVTAHEFRSWGRAKLVLDLFDLAFCSPCQARTRRCVFAVGRQARSL